MKAVVVHWENPSRSGKIEAFHKAYGVNLTFSKNIGVSFATTISGGLMKI